MWIHQEQTHKDGNTDIVAVDLSKVKSFVLFNTSIHFDRQAEFKYQTKKEAHQHYNEILNFLQGKKVISSNNPSQRSNQWLVEWNNTYDYDDADTATEAAEKAWNDMRKSDSIANFFTVTAPDGKKWEVDLSEGTEELCQ